MRSYDTETLQYLSTRDGIIARRLFWITAKDRDTGTPVSVGFWDGDIDVSMTIDGMSRTYVAAGSLLSIEAFKSDSGLSIRSYDVGLSPINDAVATALRGFDARLAPVEVHRALYYPEDRTLVGAPHRIFKGHLDELTIPEAAPGSEVVASAKIVSVARILTRTVSLKKSDESQRRRGDDRFRRYGDISGVVPVVWGEKRASK